MSEQEHCCGTCKFLQVPADSAGRRVVRKGHSYLCSFEPVWPPLPISITGRVNVCLPAPWYVYPWLGAECPVWEAHKK